MKLVPLSDRVVLKQCEAEETTKSGIILTSSAQEKPQEAEVIAVGPGGMVDGKEVTMQVEVVYGGGAASLLLNIIWLLVSGLPLAIESAIIGVLLCITIVGIPFGLQQFKLAKLALMPFGSQIV